VSESDCNQTASEQVARAEGLGLEQQPPIILSPYNRQTEL
jgi:hypothetical protein